MQRRANAVGLSPRAARVFERRLPSGSTRRYLQIIRCTVAESRVSRRNNLHSSMTLSRIALSVLLVVGLLAIGTHAAGQTFTFDRSFPATEATQLHVTTERGKITVRAGTTAEVVVVDRVSVRRGWRVPANAVALARSTANQPPVEHAGDTVRLHIPSDTRTRRAVTIAYEVLVPAGTQVVTPQPIGRNPRRRRTGSGLGPDAVRGHQARRPWRNQSRNRFRRGVD